MNASSKIFAAYGQTISVGNAAAKGFISPVNASQSPASVPLEAGAQGMARYRLLTDCTTVAVGNTVTCDSITYEVERVDKVSIFGAFSHNECILRRKGRWADV